METEVEKAINRAWAVPNRYENFPEPLLVTLRSDYRHDWEYTRALCPVKGCRYDGLPQGFNQHYARNHAPEQWRQHAKRVARILRGVRNHT